MRFKNIAVFIIAGLTIFAGCAGNQPNASLERAINAYEKALTTPSVVENAPVALHDAEKALKKAQASEEEQETTRLAQLAEKQVEYAFMVAEKKVSEKQVDILEQEKQKVLLDTRQKEIEQAKKAAAVKQAELGKKAREIEAARKQVEEAQRKSMIMKEEADKARKDAEIKGLEAKQAQEKAEKLAREIEEIKAKKTDRGLVLTLGDVLFSSGKASLMPGAMRNIDKLSQFLQNNAKRNIVIEGHTDDVGNEAYNLVLSQKRAEAVRMALAARGIGSERISTRGYGETYPIASNASKAGQQQNRRVEIIILDEGVNGTSVERR